MILLNGQRQNEWYYSNDNGDAADVDQSEIFKVNASLARCSSLYALKVLRTVSVTHVAGTLFFSSVNVCIRVAVSLYYC